MDLTGRIIGAAIEVHSTLGPGLLESAYQACLYHELCSRGLTCCREIDLPVVYKDIKVDCGYRVDLLVEETVVIELKAVDELRPIHEAQLLTYMKLGGWSIGLLMNFHAPKLVEGLRRFVL